VEAVEDEPCLWRSRGDGLDVGARHVDGDGFDLRGPLGAEFREEAAHRLGVLAGLDPDHMALEVVDDDGHVLVVLAVRQLVDPDVRQPIEAIGGAEPAHDTLHDVSHGGPGDPEHGRDGRLVGALRQVRRCLLELPGEPRPVLGPRHRLAHHSAARAVHATQPVPQQQHHAPEVQVSPA
jgi:hypothetical protein